MKFTRYPKRDAIRDYFPVPNEIFSLGLSTGEIAVYAYLMYCEDRKTFQCHPSYKTIGNAVGMSKNTVKKYVDSLIEKQLITAEPTSVITQKGEKRNGNLRYTIRPIAEALEQYYEQQLIRLHEENRRQAALKKLAEFDRKHENRRFNGSFTLRTKTSRRKPRGCTAIPRRLTADGNADRIRLCAAFKNGYKSLNLGVAAIKTSLI